MSRYRVRYEPSKEVGHKRVACPEVEVTATDVYQAAERGAWALHSQGVEMTGLFWLRVENLETQRVERLLVRESHNRELSTLAQSEETENAH